MKVVRYPGPRAFLDAVEPFLLADEACHNLLLGIPGRVIARGGPVDKVYVAAAVDGDAITGAAMMTPPWNLVLSKTAHRDAVRSLAEDAVTIHPAPPGVNGVVEAAEQFAAEWHALTGEPAKRTLSERIHRLDAVQPVPAVSGRLRAAGEADRSLLVTWVQAFVDEAFTVENRPPGEAGEVVGARLTGPGEGFMLWDDGGPRCLAGYGGATRNGIRIGPVYTPPEHRKRGYGTACVAALSRQMLERGHRFCMLYTDLANPTSNRIYRRIGYEPVCDVALYRFMR
jgi:uncharacterized protein